MIGEEGEDMCVLYKKSMFECCFIFFIRRMLFLFFIICLYYHGYLQAGSPLFMLASSLLVADSDLVFLIPTPSLAS